MLAPVSVRRSLRALVPSGMGSKVFARQAPGKIAKNLPDASHGLGLLFRVRPTPSRHSNARTVSADAPERALGRPENRTPRAAPPLRFLPLQRLAERGSGLLWPGLPHPTACAFRFSQPPDALIRPEPAGLVSCQIRSWGSPFRAFLLPRSRMPSPAPIPS
jgi:hypothetical protein